MSTGFKEWLGRKISDWLAKERAPHPKSVPLYDFDRLCYEIRVGDVLLVEGRSRVSEVIRLITQSTWSHSALYIGRLYDIEDPALRQRVAECHHGAPGDQLVIEALLGKGTLVTPLKDYAHYNTRICRPQGLTRSDAQRVIAYAIRRLGTDYDIRQLLDLARFMFPYGMVPRRWRSSLFEHKVGDPTRTVCSSMLAEAFAAVQFPILPYISRQDDGSMRLYQRNPRLFTPRDFDYSPYFDIIKYPFLGIEDAAAYRRLPWDQQGILCNDENDCYRPLPPDAKAGGAATPEAGKPDRPDAAAKTTHADASPDPGTMRGPAVKGHGDDY